MTNTQKIIFVIPCYNEANRLKSNEFIHFCEQYPLIHFLFVDDGSKDKTIDLLKELYEKNSLQIKYIQLSHNQGKAEAVRQGILHTATENDYDYIGYLDADLATPLVEIPRFIEIIRQNSDLHLIAGSRISRMGAEIERYLFRHYFGRVFATVVSSMLNLRFYDTQCGAKLLKNNIIQEVFKDSFISPWLFDVEIIFRILKINGREKTKSLIYELPLRKWEEQGQSKIRLKDLLKIPIELWKIWRKYG